MQNYRNIDLSKGCLKGALLPIYTNVTAAERLFTTTNPLAHPIVAAECVSSHVCYCAIKPVITVTLMLVGLALFSSVRSLFLELRQGMLWQIISLAFCTIIQFDRESTFICSFAR